MSPFSAWHIALCRIDNVNTPMHTGISWTNGIASAAAISCGMPTRRKPTGANRRKHGIRFDDAATVFMDPLFVLTDATRHDEARDAAIGFDQLGRLLFVVHVEFEGDCIRIVSARPAQPHEEAIYAQ